MTTKAPKISINDLRRIVREELSPVNEQIDHKAMSAVSTAASKFLEALETFKEKAPPAAMNAVTPHVSALEKALEDMVNTPGSYVSKPKQEPKKVSLKPAKQVESKKKSLKTEATGEVEEVVDASNFEHLEVGNTYLVTVGNDRVECTFVGWVDKSGAPTESEDPEQVDLRFADVSDGMEWEAYFFDGTYCGGSSADPLYVKEM
jgi:hypothetical protein